MHAPTNSSTLAQYSLLHRPEMYYCVTNAFTMLWKRINNGMQIMDSRSCLKIIHVAGINSHTHIHFASVAKKTAFKNTPNLTLKKVY